MLYESLALIVVAMVAFMVGRLMNFKEKKSNINIIPTPIRDESNDFQNDFVPQEESPAIRSNSKCMVGCSPCYPLCYGEGNPCNITAPIPGPSWQPQSASVVQKRLQEGNYVPSYCPTRGD